MEWKEVAPAACVALIFAVMVAKVLSSVASFRRREYMPLERAFSSSSHSQMVEPEGVCVDDNKTFSDLPVVEKASSSGLSIPEDSFDSQPSVCVESGSAEKSANEYNVGGIPIVDILTKKNDSLENIEVNLTTTSSDFEGNDGGEDTSKEAVRMADDEKLEQNVEDDIDDWEGVESTELEETFGAATNFVAKLAVEHRPKVSNDVQLQLYGLYKLATEGPCSTPQPSALKIASRAKWNAWQKLGVVEPEEAMREYIKKVSDLNPTWNEKSQKAEKHLRSSSEQHGDFSMDRGPMQPVFSTLSTNNDHEGDGGALDAIHASARDGDDISIMKCLENGTPVDLKDDEGRTPLHWATDRGQLKSVKILVSKGAEIQAKDQEGQTPLHYATACEYETIAEYLVQHGADPLACDNEGGTPLSCCPSSWVWMTSKT